VTANNIQLGRWTVDSATAQQLSAKPAYIAPTGGEVVLIWNLKSSSSTVKARANMLSYDYTIKDAETEPEPDEPEDPEGPEPEVRIQIYCKESEAELLKEDLETRLAGRKIEVWGRNV
jgi:hypothetical protein